MSQPIQFVQPNRDFNSDFGGRSFQSTAGPPTGLRGEQPSYGASNVPGNAIPSPEVLRDTSGRRSNATIQYNRVVPASTDAEKEFIKDASGGTLVFAHHPKASGISEKGFGTERPTRIVSLPYLLSKKKSGDGNVAHPYYPEGFAQLNRTSETAGDFARVAFDSTFHVDGGGYYVEDKAVLYLVALSTYVASKMSPALDSNEWANLRQGLRNVFVPYNIPQGYFDTVLESIDAQDTISDALHYAKQRYIAKVLYDETDGILNKLDRCTPDGAVLYRYSSSNTPDIEFDAQQNALYNIVISGHAMLTSWAQYEPTNPASLSSKLRTGPRDTLFVLLVATVFSTSETGHQVKDADDWSAGLTDKVRDDIEDKKVPVLSNFRLVRSTSEQLQNSKSYAAKKTARIFTTNHDIIIGAWRIGSTIDSAASRLDGASKFAPQTSGITASLGIRWVDASTLAKTFSPFQHAVGYGVGTYEKNEVFARDAYVSNSGEDGLKMVDKQLSEMSQTYRNDSGEAQTILNDVDDFNALTIAFLKRPETMNALVKDMTGARKDAFERNLTAASDDLSRVINPLV